MLAGGRSVFLKRLNPAERSGVWDESVFSVSGDVYKRQTEERILLNGEEVKT